MAAILKNRKIVISR